MGTLADKLNYLNQTKKEIKNALINKGVSISDDDTFRNYSQKINEIKGGADYNIFIQEQEPQQKDGIWLKDNEKTIKKITVKNNFMNMVKGYSWVQNTDLSEMPYSYNYGYRCAKVGDYIYLFGSDEESKYKKSACRYNYKNDTFEMISSSPVETNRCALAVVGTDIYIVGGGPINVNSNKTIYKYDTLNDTYKLVGNLTNGYCFNGVEVYGDYLYIFSDYVPNQKGKSYKFNILTNTLSNIAEPPFEMKYGATCRIGSNVYIFGGFAAYRTVYKYDILTNTYTQLANAPIDLFLMPIFSISKYIFLCASKKIYIYDTEKNSYTLVHTIDYDFPTASCIVPSKGNKVKVLFFGGQENYYTTIKSLEINIDEIGNDTLVVFDENADKATQLYNDENLDGRLPISFNDVSLYTIDEGYYEELERYFGDGTQWRQIQ